MSSSKLTIPVATVDPAPSADGVELISKIIGGVTQLFMIQSDGTTAIPVLTYAGSPNGAVTAGKGALCADITNAVLYQNTDGVTAWAVVGPAGSVGRQTFRYARQLGDTDTIVIALPVARPNTNYNVQVTQGEFTGLLAAATPPSSYTIAQFMLKLSAAPVAGDTFLFTVEDLT